MAIHTERRGLPGARAACARLRKVRHGGDVNLDASARTGGQLVVRIAAALCSTTVITAGLGFVFWAGAARLTTADVVGRSAAVISSIEFTAVFATLGLHTLLIAELPRRQGSRAEALVVSCFAVAATAAFWGALGVALVHHALDDGESMYASPASVVLFGVATAVSTVAIVLDGALTGLSRNRQQVLRNLVFAVVKLAALPIAALSVGLSPQMVVSAWVLGNLVSALVLLLGRRAAGDSRRWLRAPPSVRGLAPMWRTAGGHHWVNVATQAPRLLLPIMVAIQLGNAANAGFYVVLLMITFIWIVPNNLGIAMFALHSGNPQHFRTGLNAAIRLSAVVAIVAAIGGPLLADPLLSMFGPEYVHAQYCFMALAICTFAGAIKAIYIAVRRATGSLATAAKVAIAGAVWEICGAEVGLLFGGVTGLGVALGMATVVEAAFLWPVVAAARRGHTEIHSVVVAVTAGEEADLSERPDLAHRGRRGNVTPMTFEYPVNSAHRADITVEEYP